MAQKWLLEKLEGGTEYKDIKKLIIVNILDYEMLGFEEYISETEIVLKEHRDYEMLKNMKWYFIELPKFRNSQVDMNDKLNQWLAFIDDYKGERARMAEEKNDVIKKAKVEMNYLTGEEAERRLQWLREKWEMDYNSDMGQAKREGRKEGKIEIVKNLLKLNMPIEQIVKASGLTKKEVQEIKKSM